MSYRNDRRDDFRDNRDNRDRRNDASEVRRGPAEQRTNNFRNDRPAPQTDRTVEALVSFARSILNERQCNELSERLASRRAPRQDAPRPAFTDERRSGRGGRGRGGAEGGIPFGQTAGRGARGGRGGRGARGGRSDEGVTRPATAPSGDGARPPRRNNRRPNIAPQ